MNRILVTGATGFVGSNLIRDFADEKELQIVPVNLREPMTLDNFLGAGVIIHLAGKAHDLKQVANESEYFAVNVDLTKKIFDLFLQSGTRDFIYFSSVKAVADTVNGILDEEFERIPQTPYGKSKKIAEDYLLGAKIPGGKRVFILRPCMIHGPGNKGNLNLLYKVIQKGIPYPLASFNNCRSFLSISNLLFIVKQIIMNPSVVGGVYNISDDKPLATIDVIKIISESSNAKSRTWHISPRLIRIVARIGDKLRLPLNSERLKKLTENYVVSNEKIKKAIGINTLPLTAEEGLFKTIKSFRSS
jgi:nucleoside-diphosphate-sugar epimerase